MIVITSLNDTPKNVMAGDEFNLIVTDDFNSEVVIRERITVTRTIDFIASYRFTLDDGTCPGFHLAAIFGNKKDLPQEIKDAKAVMDLSQEQYDNFVKSVGVEIKSKSPYLNADKITKERVPGVPFLNKLKRWGLTI